ncbi:hypothetical protein G8B50_03595 [Enterococcus durans]|uniref:hypothetical protein n=1 Tax=Enterococcus durans TaxID=53345 RepID=UPI001883A156|nr:hypothetical protein [Enterococcus durans]MBE9886791.1 hypothetical protein [Enterococcus durans]
MPYVTYSDKNLLRYAVLKEIESDYQRFKEKALEIKPCLTRKAYRTLKNRSVKQELSNLSENLQTRSGIQLKRYIKNINRQDIPNEINRMDDELKKIRKVYLELTAIEAKFSGYPFKEKYGKKSVEMKELIGEKQKKEGELRALCGTSQPFTKTGRTRLNLATKTPKREVSFIGIDFGIALELIPREDTWAKHQGKDYDNEMLSYTKYIIKHKFTKITDASLQDTVLVACINNKNPKLIPLEKEFSLMARTYQKLYNLCIKIDKDFVSTPEIRSKIQSHIINYFNEQLTKYPQTEKRWEWIKKLHSSILTFRFYDDDYYINKLCKFVKDERTEYKNVRNTALNFLKEYEKQINAQTNELEQQLTPTAYSKFKENFQGFGDLIKQVDKHPYQGLKKFSNDILEKNKDSIEPKIGQINTYRDETVMLYRKKKELEIMLETFSYDKGSEEYNIIKTEKTQVEKRLKALCGTISPFTDKGKQMMYFRSKEEQSKSSHVFSEPNLSATNTKLLKDRMDQAKEKRKNVSESTDVCRRRTEPEMMITHI